MSDEHVQILVAEDALRRGLADDFERCTTVRVGDFERSVSVDTVEEFDDLRFILDP